MSHHVYITGQIWRYNVHPVSIGSSWVPSPRHHSRSGPLEIWCIIVENSSLLFKAVGRLKDTLGQMQSPCWLIEHLQGGYDFLLHSFCWILQQLNASFTLRVNCWWFTVSSQPLTTKLCGCMGPDQTNLHSFSPDGSISVINQWDVSWDHQSSGVLERGMEFCAIEEFTYLSGFWGHFGPNLPPSW